MTNLIIVGCGEHYRKNVAPSLAAMQAGGEINVVATVDLRPLGADFLDSKNHIPHIIRKSGDFLPDILNAYRHLRPVVILSHSHSCHATDTIDLVSHDYGVILEKPYAISQPDLSAIRTLVKENPTRVALAEYYLMMKSAPLLYAAGLIKSDSFYVRDAGYLEAPDSDRPIDELSDMIQAIGRPRMIMVDILEGEGSTGRFEQRGLQFADNRSGIGVLLDLALHAFAPILPLEHIIGTIPLASQMSLRTAVCDQFVRFCAREYGVPSEFVPETYAEIQFVTSSKVTVSIAVGKYVPKDENQRRLIIIGDEGEALLDLTQCLLSVGRRDETPTAILRSPKQPGSKYRAVIRACLEQLRGESPYRFEASAVALLSNTLTLDLFSRARDCPASRSSYSPGAPPGTIVISAKECSPVDLPGLDLTKDGEGVELYFEHQYSRIAALEDQAFKMSGGVFVLTASVFTFLSRPESASQQLALKVIVLVMVVANAACIAYMWRIFSSIGVHSKRAKAILRNAWPEVERIDRFYSHTFRGQFHLRPLIQTLLHVVLIAAGLWLLLGMGHVNSQRSPIEAPKTPVINKPPSSSLTPTRAPLPTPDVSRANHARSRNP